ncbi:MAG: hypothetical protein JJV91_00060 [Desulfosarcina sp.]|nr:hypothetical protein [Desulfobacterales bacterium]
MNDKILWTNLSHRKIAVKMEEAGISISVTVVKKLLKKYGFTKRKASKSKPIGSSKNRNDQFLVRRILTNCRPFQPAKPLFQDVPSLRRFWFGWDTRR